MSDDFSYKGFKQSEVYINLRLAEQLGLNEDTIEDIIFFQNKRHDIRKRLSYGELEPTNVVGSFLKYIDKNLQMLWFKKSDKYPYMFWLEPKCTCPYFDNQDMISNSSPIFIYSNNCPLHKGI